MSRQLACNQTNKHFVMYEGTCYISTDLQNIDVSKWKDVKALIKIVAERYNKTKQEQEAPMIRYYISSMDADPKLFNLLVRQHWGIENKLHWMLDVSMGEDASRKRAKNSPTNFSVVFNILPDPIERNNHPSKPKERWEGGQMSVSEKC